jgi:hypothetical protein
MFQRVGFTHFEKQLGYLIKAASLFCEQDTGIKKTSNNIKQPKKNKYYNEILDKPFIFNLQTVSTRATAAAPP